MLFDLRLNILGEYVDKFIVIEAKHTHSGNEKKLNFEINNFEVNLTGTFDQWEMDLRRSKDTGDIDVWFVFVNPSINNGKLPSFPTSISNEYPELLREDFIMNSVVVTDWLCAENQKEWHDLYFYTDGYYLDFCSGYRRLWHWLD